MIKAKEIDPFTEMHVAMNARNAGRSPFKPGDKIKIIHLEGEDNSYDGREGVIEFIDDALQLHGTWGSLAIIPEKDSFEKI